MVVGASAEDESSIRPSTYLAKWGKKLFIGRIPIEATVVDVQLYFNHFGHVLKVYLFK